MLFSLHSKNENHQSESSDNFLNRLLWILLFLFLFSLIPYKAIGLNNHFPPLALTIVISLILILERNINKIYFNFTDVLLCMFVLTLFFSFYWAKNRSLIWNTAISWLMFFTLFKLATLIRINSRVVIRGTKLFVLCTALNISLLLSLVFKIVLSHRSIYIEREALLQIPFFIGHNFNYITGVLSLSVPILFFAYKTLNSWRPLILTLIIFCTYFIILFESRISLFILIIQAVLIYKYILFSSKPNRKGKQLYHFITFIVVIIAYLYLTSSLYQFNLFRSLNAIGDDRIQLWHRTISFILKKPLLGVGAGNWLIENLNHDAGIYSTISDKNYYFKHPHNLFLHIAAETGLVGALCFVLIICKIIYYKLKYWIANKDDSFTFCTIMVLFSYLILASVLGVVYSTKGTMNLPQTIFIMALGISHGTTSGLFKTSHPVVFIPILILFSFNLLQINTQRNYSMYRFHKKNGENIRAMKILKSIYHENYLTIFNGISLKKEQALLFQKLGQYDKAISCLEQSLVEKNYWKDWELLGNFNAKNKSKQIENFLKAYSLNTTNIPIQLKLANLALEENKVDEAQNWLSYYYSLNDSNNMASDTLTKSERKMKALKEGYKHKIITYKKYREQVHSVQSKINMARRLNRSH